jgi:hypothetical protein
MAGRSVRSCSSKRRAHLRPADTALSEIEIAPVFHRLPERIEAHASICFKALILYRVMRQRLKLAGSDLQAVAGLSQVGPEGVLPNRCAREVRQQLREPRIREVLQQILDQSWQPVSPTILGGWSMPGQLSSTIRRALHWADRRPRCSGARFPRIEIGLVCPWQRLL